MNADIIITGISSFISSKFDRNFLKRELKFSLLFHIFSIIEYLWLQSFIWKTNENSSS